jgi:hypothetical protein
MSQFKGSLSTVALAFEETYGTVPAVPAAFLLPFKTCTVGGEVGQTTDETITGTRNPVAPDDDTADVSGDITVPVDLTAFPYLLKAMFGAPTTTGTGPYVHAFKVADSQPSFIIEKMFDNGTTKTYLRNVGCKVSKLSLGVAASGQLEATISIMGAAESLETSALDDAPTTLSLDKLQQSMASVKEGGTVLSGTLATVSHEIDFGLDGDTFAIGGGGIRGDLCEGIMGITGSISALFKAVDADSLLGKSQARTASSLETTFTKDTSSLSIKCAEVVYNKKSPGIDGPKGVKLDLSFTAYHDTDAAESAVVITVTNDVASYA